MKQMQVILSLIFSSMAMIAFGDSYEINYVSCGIKEPNSSLPSYKNIFLDKSISASFSDEAGKYLISSYELDRLKNICLESQKPLTAAEKAQANKVVDVHLSTSGWVNTYWPIQLQYEADPLKTSTTADLAINPIFDLTRAFTPSELTQALMYSKVYDKYVKNNAKRKFLIMFHGTASSADDAIKYETYFNGEIISSLLKLAEVNHDMEKYLDYIALDGVGSGNKSVHEQLVGYNDYKYDATGKIFGKGLTNNILSAKSALTLSTDNPFIKEKVERVRNALVANNKSVLPDEIYIVGWSRGAASAFYLANELAKDQELSSIPVKIFAIDPVPGGILKNFRHSYFHELPAQVKDVKIILFEDDRSRGFNPAVPKALAPAATNIDVIVLPGNHAMGVGNNYGYEELSAVSKILRNLLSMFLSKNGFNFANPWLESVADLRSNLGSIANNRNFYKEVSEKKVYGLGRERSWFGFLMQERGVYLHGNYVSMSEVPGYQKDLTLDYLFKVLR